MSPRKGRGVSRGTLYSDLSNHEPEDEPRVTEDSNLADWLTQYRWTQTRFDQAASTTSRLETTTEIMDRTSHGPDVQNMSFKDDQEFEDTFSELMLGPKPIAVPPRKPVKPYEVHANSAKVSPRKQPIGHLCARCNLYFGVQRRLEIHHATSAMHNRCPFSVNGSCSFDGTTKLELKRHLKSSGCGVPCYGCDLGFVSERERDLHMVAEHACRDCHAHFDSLEAHGKHVCNMARGTDELVFKVAGNLASMARRPEHKLVIHPYKSLKDEKSRERGMRTKVNLQETRRDSVVAEVKTDAVVETNSHGIQSTTPSIEEQSRESTADAAMKDHENGTKKSSSKGTVKCFACHSTEPSLTKLFRHLEDGACTVLRKPSTMGAVITEHWFPWRVRTTGNAPECSYCPCCSTRFNLASDAVEHMENVQKARTKDSQGMTAKHGTKPCDEVLVSLLDHLDNVLKPSRLSAENSKSPFTLSQALPKQLPLYAPAESSSDEVTAATLAIKENAYKAWDKMLAEQPSRNGFNYQMWSTLYGPKHNWQDHEQPPSHLKLYTMKDGRKVAWWVHDGHDTGPRVHRWTE